MHPDDVNLVGIMDGSAIAYNYGWHLVDSLTNVEHIETLNGCKENCGTAGKNGGKWETQFG